MDTQITALRARIAASKPQLYDLQSDTWWLLGTTGCHLCDIAEQLVQRFQAVQPIDIEHIDIADFDDDLMMHFATSIPVLLAPSKRLDYPFSVMDLQQLLFVS